MERHYLTMPYIIKAVDRPVSAPEHFISALVYCKYCDLEHISTYYISCSPELFTIFCYYNFTRMTNTEVSDTSSN